jgi:hypothetical protein
MRPLSALTPAALVSLAVAQFQSLPAVLPSAPVPLEYYLPSDGAYDPAFPRPESVLGWTVGEWHVRHDQLLEWCRTVASASPRVVLEPYGRTHEDRTLLLATITSPANHARLEELRRAHVEAVLAGAAEHEGPEVVWLGYGVHGNEPSASNAALVVLYHLAAATGPEIEAFLEDTIVVLDPCLNPDGHSRFAQWANAHRGKHLVADPAHREHREVWPGGRTNHYWFDLNRDWLLLTHPESRGRVAAFQRWMPCVLTDYHEMGTDSTYFFQPGIPSRSNPITPAQNIVLTRAIAEHHAAALDRLGSLYFTEESFDDFYYGKGSTYPDIQGCIGILFEQASSRGHVQENSFGGVTFPFTIRNQVTTSLSTLAAVDALRADLSRYQRASFQAALEEARAYEFSAYVFGAPEDPTRTQKLAELLHRHGIAVHHVAAELEVAGTRHSPGGSFLVPVAQPRFRLVRALFETRSTWDDNSFYDVSSWTLPLSFGVPYGGVAAGAAGPDVLGAPFTPVAPTPGTVEEAEGAVAWALEWPDSAAAPALVRLLARGVHVRVATDAFDAATPGGVMSFGRGTLLVPRGRQTLTPEVLRAALADAAALGVGLRAVTSGLTGSGVDLGSTSFKALALPRPLLVIGDGVSGYEAGEAWFELDARLGLPVSMVERDDLAGLDLARYSHLLLVTGANTDWSEALLTRVKTWVASGGVVIATRGASARAAKDLLQNKPATNGVDPADPRADAAPLPYDSYDAQRAAERIAGAIFEVDLDLTHPLTYGLTRPTLPVFRSSEALLPEANDPFSTPARYRAEPLISGYCSPENVARLAMSPAVRAERIGRGTVICIVDDPLFRGVWYGTRRLHHNAMFFASAIDRTGPLGVDDAVDGEELEGLHGD